MNPVYIAVMTIVFYIGLRQAFLYRAEFLKSRILQGISVLSVFFSLMIVIGAKIQPGDTIQSGSRTFESFKTIDIFWFLFYIVIGIVVFFNLYLLSQNRKIQMMVHPTDNQSEKLNTKRWLLYSLILAAAWIPVFISYYPGIVPEDGTCSIAMVIGELPWENHFPIFYSLIVGAFIAIGYLLDNINIGIACYSIFQFIVMAGGIGFFLSWLHKKGIGKVCIYFALAYFAAAPMFGNYAIVMWKDPMFSGLLILISIFLYENVAQRREAFLEKKNLILYAIILVFMCLMRNNGIYIAILINMCLFLLYRKHLKKVILTLAGSIAIVFLITGPLYQQLLSAESPFVESVGIPLQQMARTVVTGGKMDEKDKEFMNRLLPLEQYDVYYVPYLVDPVKWADDFDTDFLEAHKKEFFETWLSMLKNNFGTYVEQYLMGTYGYWHIGGDVNYELVKVEIAENTWGMYMSNPLGNFTEYQIKDTFNEKYDYIATGLLVWFLLFDMMLCWMKKKSVYIMPLLVMAGVWITIMIATPTAFGIRYIYVFVLGLPLLFSYPWLIQGQEENETKQMQTDTVSIISCKE